MSEIEKLAEDIKSVISSSRRGYVTESQLTAALRGGSSAMRAGLCDCPTSGRRWSFRRGASVLDEIEFRINEGGEQFSIETIKKGGGSYERRIAIAK